MWTIHFSSYKKVLYIWEMPAHFDARAFWQRFKMMVHMDHMDHRNAPTMSDDYCSIPTQVDARATGRDPGRWRWRYDARVP